MNVTGNLSTAGGEVYSDCYKMKPIWNVNLWSISSICSTTDDHVLLPYGSQNVDNPCIPHAPVFGGGGGDRRRDEDVRSLRVSVMCGFGALAAYGCTKTTFDAAELEARRCLLSGSWLEVVRYPRTRITRKVRQPQPITWGDLIGCASLFQSRASIGLFQSRDTIRCLSRRTAMDWIHWMESLVPLTACLW